MAFVIPQKNYTKRPTSRQRRLLRYLNVDVPGTRIEAHLKIETIKQTQSGKDSIKAYKILEASRLESARRANAQSGAVGNP